ncbi:MAG: hypothetical protein ACKOI2_00895, partial [Actinomycetota bacterium]
TRPTPRAERLVPRTFGRIVLAVGTVLIVISFGNSFIWLPAKSWIGQRNEAAGRQTELDTLRQASDQIQKEIDWPIHDFAGSQMKEFPNEMTMRTAPTVSPMRPNVLGTRRSALGVGRVRSP